MAPRALAWQDGRVLPASEATIPLLDDGFLRGDAVIEGMLVLGGRTHAREAHLTRMRRSAKAVGLRLPVVTHAIRDLLVTWGDHDGVLKVLVTRGGAVRAFIQTRSVPTAVSLARVEMPWRSPISGVKSVSYGAHMLATRMARDEGHADDAVVTSDGIVLEVPTASIVWRRDGQWRTPDAKHLPIIASVTLAELGKIAKLEHGQWDFDDLLGADEAFIISASRLIVPVHAVEDASLPSPGPATADLQAELLTYVRDNLD